jgi:hypothetical protein
MNMQRRTLAWIAAGLVSGAAVILTLAVSRSPGPSASAAGAGSETTRAEAMLAAGYERVRLHVEGMA